jgi:hypothetical protein
MSVDFMKSFSPERAADVSVGTGGFALSFGAAWGCSNGVTLIGKKTEEFIRTFWETSKPVPSATAGMPMQLAPAHFIPSAPVIQTIQACTNSGKSAAITVGFIETIYQSYRYAKSDHNKSWGTDMIEGGYRGCAIGAGTGFLTGGENLEQRIAAAVVGGIVGSFLGNGIALIGHIFRSIHMPK